MKITKQKTWLMIEIMMAAFLIISSCEEPDKPGTDSVTLTQNKSINSIALQTTANLKKNP